MNFETTRTLALGIDIGSTTAKVVLADEKGDILLSSYERHHADVLATVAGILASVGREFSGAPIYTAITGSAGMALADAIGVPFVQEVVALRRAVVRRAPQTDVAIELGGEDAKIVYFTDGVEQRMNGSCAGGTGAFIDQMAVLLDTDAAGLNELAKGAQTIYPIASRCGVFAKTDVQPLLNEGARREDIAASVLRAVVNQTIAGLACGRPIQGTVALVGGPLHYLSELRRAFREGLGLTEEEMVVPPRGQIIVAYGAALVAAESDKLQPSIEDIQARLATANIDASSQVRLAPLFANSQERGDFEARAASEALPTASLNEARGATFLGIDAGSTTFKLALIDAKGRILYESYCGNDGDVVGRARDEIAALYRALPVDEQGRPLVHIAHAASTGYGEELVKAAFALDSGEIETMAHLRAARQLDPKVDFVLDIGGQDMKCMRVKDGVIDDVILNEACSAGCGSFLETFAQSMRCSVQQFAQMALESTSPVDLGSRCTVFMNSRVKQAQKEGATLADIAAGLAYSVVKNALYKVIKLRDASQMGDHVVVQGGTFANDAVLRAFEIVSGRIPKRPVQAGLMGAYGAALIARDRGLASPQAASTILPFEALENFEVTQSHVRCKGCGNACRLTISDFGEGRRFVAGNRCERGAAGGSAGSKDVPNVMEYRAKRLFSYEQSADEERTLPSVGIPRALNMYENYPFWFTFFDELGFRVRLSSPTSENQFRLGMDTIPSESVCYPAKVAHGHIAELTRSDVDFIFMPCIRHEVKEGTGSQNCFNCPVVSSYPEALRLNCETDKSHGVPIVDPYLPYGDDRRLARRLHEELEKLFAAQGEYSGTAPTLRAVKRAVRRARAEDAAFKADVRRAGEKALQWMEQTGSRGIVLAGRPYHDDPAVNHAIPNLIRELGFAVLTEDSVAHLAKPEGPLRTFNQWTYHARLYAAAKFVTTRADLELVQLNSFGCGLDAVTTDQVGEILQASGKLHTVLKIDEVSNTGAARIRLRSLAAALQMRGAVAPHPKSTAYATVPFTKKMKREGYTIIAPQMAPTHFKLIEAALRGEGYRVEVLPADDPCAVDAGLRYVNNDICYPSILTTGQIMAAVESGRYDLDKLAVLIVQTGGGCRATNYIALIRKALEQSGNGHVPVISLSFSGIEKNPGWKLSPRIIAKSYFSLVLGDVLSQCLLRTRPYERDIGSANELFEAWMRVCCENLPTMGLRKYVRFCQAIIADFDGLPLVGEGAKPRVGVVGEILVKYHPTANNHVVDCIEAEGCEAVVPGLTDFFQFAGMNMVFRRRDLDESPVKALGGSLLAWAIDYFRREVHAALVASRRFRRPVDLRALAERAEPIVQLCNNMGEGWLMTAEMIGLIDEGAPNIVLCSPFGCLPNHVIGKAVLKELKERYPAANVVAVDYDPGAAEVNQINRIKLMCSVAKERHGAPRPLAAPEGAPASADASGTGFEQALCGSGASEWVACDGELSGGEAIRQEALA